MLYQDWGYCVFCGCLAPATPAGHPATEGSREGGREDGDDCPDDCPCECHTGPRPPQISTVLYVATSTAEHAAALQAMLPKQLGDR